MPKQQPEPVRKVVSYLICSVDGVVQDNQDFALDYFDDEMYGHLKALIDRQDGVLLGRRTHEMWADYWQTSTAQGVLVLTYRPRAS